MLTQCPNCKTLFRVTAEQLHAVNGMVRCGFCYGTFNALQHLTEPLSDIPPPNVPDEEIVDDLPLIEEQVRIPLTRSNYIRADKAETVTPTRYAPEPRYRREEYDDSDNDIDLLFDDEDDDLRFDESLAELEFEPEPEPEPDPEPEPPEPEPPPRPVRKPLPKPMVRPEPKRAPQPAKPPERPSPPPKPKATPAPSTRAQPLAPAGDLIASFFETDPKFHQASEPAMVASPRAQGRPISLNSWSFSTSAWVIAILVLTLLIFAQYSYFMRNELARVASFRPWLETLCSIANCELPMLRDISRISLVSRDMRSHPTRPKALLVRATAVNEASFIQPFPELRLMLSDLNGTILASRQFRPTEYINTDTVDIAAGMLPQTHYDFQLEMVDANRNAVSFEFQFL